MMVSMAACFCDGLLELPLHMIDFLTLGTTITTSPSSMLSSVLGCKMGGQPIRGELVLPQISSCRVRQLPLSKHEVAG